MVQTEIWQMTLFQNLILFTNRYGNLQEVLEMASILRFVDLYLTSEWGRFYAGHSVFIMKMLNLWLSLYKSTLIRTCARSCLRAC
jgi:hypothetical protein